LPTFDSKFENWLSFKNAFHNLIDSYSDLSDIDKLYYFKSALKDEAANKIKIFAMDGINYAKAWEVLERAYEVKRVLITRHLSFIVNLPSVGRESTDGLTKLADDTQQHLASLNALGVSVRPEMIVHLLEGKLPKKLWKDRRPPLRGTNFRPSIHYTNFCTKPESAFRREIDQIY